MGTKNEENYGALTLLCCFVFLLACSSLWIVNGRYSYAEDVSTARSVYIKNIQRNKSNQVSLNCNTAPVYFISQGQWSQKQIKTSLKKLGFNKTCTRRERTRIGLKPWPGKRKVLGESCFKYTNMNNTFCNGAQLILMDRGEAKFRLKIINLESKTALHKTLSLFCNKYHKACNFHLLSYNIGIPNERIKFLTNHIDCNNNHSQYDKTWVFKEYIDFGSGIHIINNHQQIYQLITANVSENINNCTFNPIKNKTYFEEEGIINYYKINDGYVINRTGCLIQSFVNNPLLVKVKPNEIIRHVFHVRSYLLVASYSNPMIVLHWPRPILMINPNEYNNRQKKLNKQAILTNRHVMEKDGKFTDDSYEWIWGRTQFQNYLNEEYGNDLFGGNYTTKKLNNDIKHIAETVFRANAYNNKLKQNMTVETGNKFHWDIWCMDIIVNDKFELKLMEMNAGLCLHMCDPNKIKKKKMNGGYDWDCDNYYSEGADIIMEVSIKKTFNDSIETIESLNKWEIVYRE